MRSVMAKTWRVPSARTVSMVTSSADSGLPAAREPKARRHAVLEYFERQRAGAGLQVAGLVMVVSGIRVGVAMRVTMWP